MNNIFQSQSLKYFLTCFMIFLLLLSLIWMTIVYLFKLILSFTRQTPRTIDEELQTLYKIDEQEKKKRDQQKQKQKKAEDALHKHIESNVLNPHELQFEGNDIEQIQHKEEPNKKKAKWFTGDINDSFDSDQEDDYSKPNIRFIHSQFL